MGRCVATMRTPAAPPLPALMSHTHPHRAPHSYPHRDGATGHATRRTPYRHTPRPHDPSRPPTRTPGGRTLRPHARLSTAPHTATRATMVPQATRLGACHTATHLDRMIRRDRPRAHPETTGRTRRDHMHAYPIPRVARASQPESRSDADLWPCGSQTRAGSCVGACVASAPAARAHDAQPAGRATRLRRSAATARTPLPPPRPTQLPAIRRYHMPHASRPHAVAVVGQAFCFHLA
jgi:hypothetical protein